MTEVDHLADEAIIAIVPARGDGLAVFSYVRSRDGEWAGHGRRPFECARELPSHDL